uniref:tRNA-splicing endonuclease subunit Sen34 n=1 Tax=Myxine glutinosa TaxID=7769 RepID=UPI00358E31D6
MEEFEETREADVVTRFVPLFLCADTALVWNAGDVKFLREKHRLTGTLFGSLARQPRQNCRSGLPLRLQPEEVRLALEQEFGLLARRDDPLAHCHNASSLNEGIKSCSQPGKNSTAVFPVCGYDSSSGSTQSTKQTSPLVPNPVPKLSAAHLDFMKQREQMWEEQKILSRRNRARILLALGPAIAQRRRAKCHRKLTSSHDSNEHKCFGEEETEGKGQKSCKISRTMERNVVAPDEGGGIEYKQESEYAYSLQEKNVELTVANIQEKMEGEEQKDIGSVQEEVACRAVEDKELKKEGLQQVFEFPKENLLVQIPTGTWRHDGLQEVEWKTLSLTRPHLKDPREDLRYKVFRDTWSRGFYLTTGGKFGGDFLLYPGDPLRYHAHYIAMVVPESEKLSLTDLVAAGRLGTTVRKTLLLCSSSEDGQIYYTSLRWSGWK